MLETILSMPLQETRMRALVQIEWSDCPSGPVYEAANPVGVVRVTGDEDIELV